MHPYLVSSSCFQDQLHQGCLGVFLQNSVMSNGGFPLICNDPMNAILKRLPNRSINGATHHRKLPMNKSKIYLLNFSFIHLFLNEMMHIFIFCNGYKARGISI